MEAAKRLLVALVILAIGFAIAWQFRKRSGEQEIAEADIPTVTMNVQSDDATEAGQGDRLQGVPLPAPFDPRPKLSGPPRVAPAPSLREPEMPKYYQPNRVAPSVLPPALKKILDSPSGQRSAPQPHVTGKDFTNVSRTPVNSATGSSPPVNRTPRPKAPTVRQGFSSPASDATDEREHTIVNGDTLSRIAKRYLGNADRHREIYELNRDVLRDPDVLPIGQTIRLPSREQEPRRPRTAVENAPVDRPAPKLVPVSPEATPQT
ncbi:MAG: LysM peptidoglycan-binding domain-containing protein [Pirellulales bacterium]